MFFLILVIFLLIAGGITLIMVQNLTPAVHIQLFAWKTPALPLGVWILAAFVLGALLLYLVSLLSAWTERRELKRLRKRVHEQSPEADPQVVEEVTTSSGPLASGPAPSTGPMQAAYIPMPGIKAPPLNGNSAPLPTPDFRQ